MKKRIAKILIILILLFNFNNITKAFEHNSGYLIELYSGRVLYSQNEDVPYPIASITKLMTYYVFRDFMGKININYDDIYKIRDGFSLEKGYSSINLKSGDEISIRELLESMLIPSANDSAMTLREIIDLKGFDFILEMNNKAKQLGMKNTNYINPTGITEEGKFNVSSAKDLSILVYNIMNDYPEIFSITSKKEFIYKDRIYKNTNEALFRLKNVDGLKTGTTDEAGYCLLATRDLKDENGKGKPFKLCSIVLGCKSSGERFNESIGLLEEGKKKLSYELIVPKSKEFIIEDNRYKDEIKGFASDDIYFLKKSDEEVKIDVKFDKLKGKIHKGDTIGKVILTSLESGKSEEYTIESDSTYSRKFFLIIWFNGIVNFLKNIF